MCMFDDADPSQFLSEADVKARKEHRCDECNRTILKGEIYHRDSVLHDGEFCSYKTCRHCMVARAWLVKECGGYVFCGLRDDIEEHVCTKNYALDLARLLIGMRRKWQAFKGSLMPVPAIPELTP